MESMKFTVETADAMGMCTGLRRILVRVERQLATGPATVLGEFVHNAAVYEDLERRGARHVESPDDVWPGETVVVGPHGSRRSVLAAIAESGGSVVDTSCPRVLRVIEAGVRIAQSGLPVGFVGRRGHEECQMLAEVVPDLLVLDESLECEQLPRRLGLVAQSTITEAHYAHVVALLRSTGRVVTAADTICPETIARQNAASELATRVDIVVVVGAGRSHNTMALAQTCGNEARVIVVNDPRELRAELFDDVTRVGVTAGASTPDGVVYAVTKRLRGIAANCD